MFLFVIRREQIMKYNLWETWKTFGSWDIRGPGVIVRWKILNRRFLRNLSNWTLQKDSALEKRSVCPQCPFNETALIESEK